MKFATMITIACALFGAMAWPVHAADEHMHAQAMAQQASYTAKGEVVAVEKAAARVKLKHAAIAELKWPAMTMYFAVADSAQLDTLRPGDPVEFRFEKVSGGAPLIRQIKTVK